MATTPRRASLSSLQTVTEHEVPPPPHARSNEPFNVVSHYASLLTSDDSTAMPIAAIEALSSLITSSPSTSTSTELFSLLHSASLSLSSASYNPISLNCGTSLFLRFLTLQRPPPEMGFDQFKEQLVQRAREFVRESGRCRDGIARGFGDFVKEGGVILVHSYSRVVVHALLHAAGQKKRFQVYVTESRPFGLGLKTHAILAEAGIESMVILDSAVAYVMGKVDMCVVGAEAVCESGGLVNFIGGYGMAIAAKAHRKPLYALAESYKFTRLFPLSQYDLPSSLPLPPLTFTSPASPLPGSKSSIPTTPSRPMLDSPMPNPLVMNDEMTKANPTLDYTTPDLVALLITDLGVMTPSGVSDALLGIYGGE